MVLGTADYIAPEQAAAPRSADIRADIYSLGCTFYYLLAGHPPFPDGTLIEKLKAHSEQVPLPLSTVRPDAPAGLARIVEMMMAKDHSQRFQRPVDVAAALVAFVDTKAAGEALDRQASKQGDTLSVAASSASAQTQDEQSMPQPNPKPSTRSRRARVGIAGLFAVLAGTVGLLWAESPGWPGTALLYPILGYAVFFGLQVAGCARPRSCSFSLRLWRLFVWERRGGLGPPTSRCCSAANEPWG